MDSKQYSGETAPEQLKQRTLTPGLESEVYHLINEVVTERMAQQSQFFFATLDIYKKSILELQADVIHLRRPWYRKLDDWVRAVFS